MRKFALLLTIISMISCGKKTNSNAVDSDSIAEVIDSAVSFHEEYIPSTDTKEMGITLDFSSYHLYTCEEDKYNANGYQPVSAKVTIDEASNAASLKLYDSGEHKWYPFDFRIDEKLHLQEGVITYKVYNNANQVGYIYISTNRPDGLFVDINNFIFDGNPICCWMQESGSSGSQYRQETVTIESTPNTYPSSPSYSPNLSGGSIHSEERITGNYSNYSNYEETDNCVEGVVVYEGDDDYYIVETRKGFTILERYSGRLDEGDKVRGELNKYKFKYLINRNRSSEVKVYIEDYMLSDDDAVEWLGKNNHLKSNDQRAYDANNN